LKPDTQSSKLETRNSKHTTAVIVAGGRSRRFGSDKRRLRLWGDQGPTLLERTAALVGALCDETLVVLNDPDGWPELHARKVSDAYPGAGPLGGIWSGLAAATHPYALVVAADMPLLEPGLLRWMIEQPRDYDVLAPRASSEARNRLSAETMHTMYSRACLDPIRHALEAGERQVVAFFSSVRVRYVEPEVLTRLDPGGLALRNINTPEDLELVQQAKGKSHV
jgi:molybdopterin-guanine dinucleotide biosynthesis protein A